MSGVIMSEAAAVDVAEPTQDPPVASRPLIRELAGWPVFLAGAGRVIAHQASHPTIAKGLYDHSTAVSNPLSRGRLTIEYAMRILFGTDRAATAAEIRALHTDVKGTGFDGRPYHAWNREAWTWVHLTTFEALLYGVRAIHGEPPLELQQACYDQVKEVGLMYGVRAQDMPDDIAGLHAFIREVVATKLTHVPNFALFQRQPSFGGLPIPESMRRRMVGAASRPVQLLAAGAYPSTIRERWGIRWSPVHEAAYQAELVALRAATALLPDRLRLMPYAYRALNERAA
jgi:uncharacterized protein (DUF2236 family)